MHSDAQGADSSSVPAHVEMMGFLGMGNNPMVGATVAVAVAIQQAMTSQMDDYPTSLVLQSNVMERLSMAPLL